MKQQDPPCNFITNSKFTLQQAKTIIQPTVPYQNIYLGGVDTLTQANLSKYKINAVLTIMTDKQQRKSKLQKKIQELDDINKHISLMVHDDNQSIAPYFLPSIDFINQAVYFGMNVLVHCKTGNQRSAAIMAAFLIYHLKIKWQAAYQILKSKRNSIEISQRFREQLSQQEEKLISLKSIENK